MVLCSVPNENSVRAFAAAKPPIETARLERSGERLDLVEQQKLMWREQTTQLDTAVEEQNRDGD